MNSLNLETYRNLFPDDASFNQFVERIVSDLQFDLRPIMVGEKMLGLTLSPEGAKDVLYERMVSRMAKDPSVLSDLADRLENDDIVE
ncbi:hypothetical protein Mal4_06410 [Maioricimonas rarisocia]|uniref:Uncharacterized protein n=1 Tax=Maioricimonas rarisocia TaxID=2528026 RepID=A0A517Z1J2_9PLAN|nr:hypothetical protein [Maioricimonas rarisocia]QDU36356.1 hypothetical protein Mal4_06410 [Maioricimonas rarisocia]